MEHFLDPDDQKTIETRYSSSSKNFIRRNSSFNQILKETQLPVCRRTILNVIKDSGFMEYGSMDHRPKLNSVHMDSRLKFAEKYMTYADKWINGICINENSQFLL